MKRDASAFNNAVCKRTKELRVELCGKRGRSQLAKMLGISPSTYHYYERGRVLPADLLVKLCDLANANIEWLLLGSGAKYSSKKGGAKKKAAKKTNKRRK
ncbi:MAG: helix-turn-helix transcriptional regulator [Planctomycetes bacterium]|nr:helix-turn-helix transcriptional regulator [Planctomycetota bacterium]